MVPVIGKKICNILNDCNQCIRHCSSRKLCYHTLSSICTYLSRMEFCFENCGNMSCRLVLELLRAITDVNNIMLQIINDNNYVKIMSVKGVEGTLITNSTVFSYTIHQSKMNNNTISYQQYLLRCGMLLCQSFTKYILVINFQTMLDCSFTFFMMCINNVDVTSENLQLDQERKLVFEDNHV